MYYRNITKVLLLVISVAGLSTAQNQDRMVEEKAELERVKKQVDRSQEVFDSLKNEEVSTQKRISEQDQKIATNQKVIQRLNSQMGNIRSNLRQAEKELEDHQNLLDRTRRKYLGDIRQYYLRISHYSNAAFWEDPSSELETARRTVYMAAWGGFESDNVKKATSDVFQAVEQVDKLTGEQKQVTTLKKKKEVATALEESKKQKGQKELEGLRRKKLAEGDRMLTLQQAAEEMEQVIARLEEARQERQQTGSRPSSPSVFATLKGQLKAPYRGKIITPFGSFEDPITRLESYSPGIIIKGKPGASVVAVAGGNVVYVGNLRGYGNFVIIDHDDQYYTTYGGLGETLVSQGAYITESAKLAAAGDDGQVKFELRKGRVPLDPVQWIRIDSF